MGRFTKILRGVSLLTQLGLSVAAPPLLLVWLSQWLQKRYALGAWVTIAGLVVGLISSACGMFQFYKSLTRKTGKEDDPPPSFDQHT